MAALIRQASNFLRNPQSPMLNLLPSSISLGEGALNVRLGMQSVTISVTSCVGLTRRWFPANPPLAVFTLNSNSSARDWHLHSAILRSLYSSVRAHLVSSVRQFVAARPKLMLVTASFAVRSGAHPEQLAVSRAS